MTHAALQRQLAVGETGRMCPLVARGLTTLARFHESRRQLRTDAAGRGLGGRRRDSVRFVLLLLGLGWRVGRGEWRNGEGHAATRFAILGGFLVGRRWHKGRCFLESAFHGDNLLFELRDLLFTGDLIHVNALNIFLMRSSLDTKALSLLFHLCEIIIQSSMILTSLVLQLFNRFMESLVFRLHATNRDRKSVV